MLKKVLVLFTLIFSLGSAAQLQIPALTDPVIDQAGLLTGEDRQVLRQLIFDFHNRGKAQLQILTLQNLGGLPIEQASIQILDRWKLGNQKRDDGVLILVAAQEHRMRIEVGQGLEGVLPDIKAKRIIEDTMVPLFRKASPSQGIVAGTLEVIRTIDPEYSPSVDVPASSGSDGGDGGGNRYEGLFILIFVIIMILGNLFRPRRRTFWGGGGWGGGWGGGGFGGGSGGGWGGGGGGFSGGGASGSW